MKLEASSHHLIDLIKEDIKLNYLVFGLKELGLESHLELFNLSPIIFNICGISFQTQTSIVEEYYNEINLIRELPFTEVCKSIDDLAENVKQILVK